MPITPDVLSNDEKVNIINQHIRSLKFAQYNADLDLIEANAVSNPDTVSVSEINSRKTAIAARIAALDAEKAPLEEE
jgi:hypothetical protein